MTISCLVLSTAAAISAINGAPGTAPVQPVSVGVSEGALSVISLPEGQAIVDAVLQDGSSVDMFVANGRMIVLRGAPGARGTHLLVRRSVGLPLDVTLLPAAGDARSGVVHIAGGAPSRIPEWRVDGGRLSVLKPGFTVTQAYSTPGVRAESLASDGAFVATRGSASNGDVVVVGAHGEMGIYRLD